MSITTAIPGSFGFPLSETILVTTAGTGSVLAPPNTRSVSVEAVGGGGNGAQGNGNQGRSGGGAAYAGTFDISVLGGTTTIYYQVGAAATSSWVNVGTNTVPASTAQGCLADFGKNAVSGGANGTGGTTAASIGTTKFNGAAGTSGSSGVGGGAAGDSAAASGQTGGAGTHITGGNGGASNTAGSAPGGGGGGGATTGGAGAPGLVRITFNYV